MYGVANVVPSSVSDVDQEIRGFFRCSVIAGKHNHLQAY